MGDLRAGIIGCGSIARLGHVPSLREAGVEVVAVCDTNLARARAFASEFGIPDAYADHDRLLSRGDVDLVTVGIPNALHADVTIAALERGVHVLCEKPISTSVAEAERMIAAANAGTALLSVNQHMRFDPSALAMREAVTDGRLGAVYLTEARMIRQSGIPGYGSWFTNSALAGHGALFDIGVHMLDLALFLLGFPEVVAVRGQLGADLGTRGIGLGDWGVDHVPGGGFDVDDFAAANLTLADGSQVRVTVSWAVFGAPEERVTLFGTEGGADRSAELYGPAAPLRLFGLNDHGRIDEVVPDLRGYGTGGWPAAAASFVRAVRGEAPLLVLPEEALATMRILERIAESARVGRELTL